MRASSDRLVLFSVGKHKLGVTLKGLVALYRAIRLRFGYGFQSCNENGPRNFKNANAAFFPQFSVLVVRKLVLKVPKRGQFHVVIRVTTKRYDSCAQRALGRRTVSRQNFCDAESLAKRYGETCQ